MKKIYLSVIFSSLCIMLNAQLWYFGDQAGLDFTSGTVTHRSAMVS